MKNYAGYLIAGILGLFIAGTILYCAVVAGIVGLFGYFVIVIVGVCVYNRTKTAIKSMKGN